MIANPKLEPSQLNRRWRPALLSFFLRRVRNRTEAEDLTQEVFARLLGASGAREAPKDAYVFQIAANLLRDHLRRSQVRDQYHALVMPLEDQAADSLDPARIAMGHDDFAALIAGLDALPERTRMIFTLYRLENLSFEAIAASYGISRSAVKKHVRKAMAALMARMREPS